MKKLALLLIALMTGYLHAQNGSVQGTCAASGIKVMTQGMASSTLATANYPSCSVTVYLTGTTIKATIYTTISGAPLGNPFTANIDATWLFFAMQAAGLDVVMSGGTPPLPAPVTLVGLFPGGGGAGGGGCGVAGCIVSVPTTAQTINVPHNTTMFTSGLGCEIWCTNDTAAMPTPSDGQQTWNGIAVHHNLFDSTYGQGYNFSGEWTVDVSQQMESLSYRGGIQGMFQNVCEGFHAGDVNCFYEYNKMTGGQTTGSDEDITIFKENGIEEPFYTSENVVSSIGIGDTHPVLSLFSGVNHMSGWNMLIETNPSLSTNLAGNTPNVRYTLLGQPPQQFGMFVQPISGGATPSTGICVLTAAVTRNLNTGIPISHTAACPVGIGAMVASNIANPIDVTGVAVVADGKPEGIKITNVTGSGASTVITFLSANEHPAGAYVVQGGTQGCLHYVQEDPLRTYTDYRVFGATDATHLLWGKSYHELIAGAGYPLFGYNAQTATGPVTVNNCARILSLGSTGMNPIALDFNKINMTPGEVLTNPHSTTFVSHTLSTGDVLYQPGDASMSSTGEDFEYGDNGAGGANFARGIAGFAYLPMKLQNNNEFSAYMCTNCVTPPTPGFLYPITGITFVGPHAQLLQGNPPIGGLPNGGCTIGTVICIDNGNPFQGAVNNYGLWTETGNLGQRALVIDNYTFLGGAQPTEMRLQGMDFLVSGITNSRGGFQANGQAANGTFLRGDGNRFVGNTIQYGDTPLGDNNLNGALHCGTNTNCTSGAIAVATGSTGVPGLLQCGAGVVCTGGVISVGGSTTGTTGLLGGTAMTAGSCLISGVSVAAAIQGHPVAVAATGGALVDPLIVLSAAADTAGHVFAQICAIAAVTPVARTYNVAVF